MPYVVATCMSPAGWRGLGLAMRLTAQVGRALRTQPGFLGGRILADRSLRLWTLSVWADQEALRAFRGVHAPVAARGPEVAAGQGLVLTRWQQDGAAVPTWADLASRWSELPAPKAGASRPLRASVGSGAVGPPAQGLPSRTPSRWS